MIRMAMIAAATLLAATSAWAQEKTVGDWLLKIEKDRFSGASATKTMAMRLQSGDAIVVRCFPSGLSVVVGDLGLGHGRYQEGMQFSVKFRADQNPILETSGMAVNDKFIEVERGDKIIQEMLTAKEYAFRFAFKGVTFDRVFTAGTGARQAIETVMKACNKY